MANLKWHVLVVELKMDFLFVLLRLLQQLLLLHVFSLLLLNRLIFCLC